MMPRCVQFQEAVLVVQEIDEELTMMTKTTISTEQQPSQRNSLFSERVRG